MLFLDGKENRRLLAGTLAKRYEVILADTDDALEEDFDLCILDGPALNRLRERVRERKQKDVAQFLPCLLVTARRNVGMATRFLWKVVDDVLISPIEKIELQARVESLLLARRLSKEFSRSIIEQAELGIIVLDRQGTVHYWSPACERILGWSAGEVVGTLYPIVPAELNDEYRLSLEMVFRGETLSNVETIWRKKDGSPVYIRFLVSPLRDSDGIITHALSLVTDISEKKRAEEMATRRMEHLLALRAIDTAITSGLDLRLTLNILLEQVVSQLKVDAADILLFDPTTNLLGYAAGQGFRSSALQHTLLRIGEGYAGRVVLERHTVHIPDVVQAGGELAQALAMGNETFVAYFGAPLIAKGQVKGVLEIFHRAPLEPDHEWRNLLDTLAGQAAIAIDNLQLFENLQRSNVELALAYESTIEGWSRALDLRDKETEGHTLRVTEMVLKLACLAGMAEEELTHVRRGALLHDIGKMGVPDHILFKPDKLTDEEWAIMRRHPQYAYDLLAPIEYLRPALDIPYCHHEKWDGSGYPRGLKGEQIPLAARLFAVVDVWDALRSDRPYRQGWTEEKVLEYIRSQAGKHFDPQAVELFLQVINEDAQGAG